MGRAFGLFLASLACAELPAVARAQTAPEACPPPPPCLAPQPGELPFPLVEPLVAAADEPAPEAVKLPKDAVVALGIGFAMLGASLSLTTAHFVSSDQPARALDFVPVVGPLVVAGMSGKSSPGWTSALVFSSWGEAAAIMTLAVTADYIFALRKSPVKVGAGLSPSGASLGLSSRF